MALRLSSDQASISQTYPQIFANYDQRMWEPGGFKRPLPARERDWKTDIGNANFKTPRGLGEDSDMPQVGHDVLRLITLALERSIQHDGLRLFRPVRGHRGHMRRPAHEPYGHRQTAARARGDRHPEDQRKDKIERKLGGLQVVPYDIPVGCIGAYYPEANVLLPIWHHAEGSKVLAAKSIPVTIHKESDADPPSR